MSVLGFHPTSLINGRKPPFWRDSKQKIILRDCLTKIFYMKMKKPDMKKAALVLGLSLLFACPAAIFAAGPENLYSVIGQFTRFNK